MKKFFAKIHLWLSIPFGIIIAIVCLTGAILVFETEILELCYPSRYFVKEVKGEMLSPAVLMGAAGGLEPLRQPGRQQLETAQRMMELVGIAPLADRGIRRISGGERQLTLIARALAQQARILLMDEPAANLDYGNQFRLLQQVRRLTEQGYTVLLSTHNPEHALRFATHVLALHGGTVAACGPVEEMLTEELLHTLYRIPLTVAQVPVTGATVRSCVYDPAKP